MPSNVKKQSAVKVFLINIRSRMIKEFKINFPTLDFTFAVVFYGPLENRTKSILFGLSDPFLVLF